MKQFFLVTEKVFCIKKNISLNYYVDKIDALKHYGLL